MLNDPGRFFPAPIGVSRPVATDLLDEAARQYAARYGVSQETALARLREQGRLGGLQADLRARLGDGFGQLSFDNERGMVKVLLSPSGDERRAREVLAEHGVDDAIYARSAWSARELDEATTELARQLAPQVEAGTVAIRQVADDGLVVAVDPDAEAPSLTAARRAAGAATVEPKLVREEVSRPQAAACTGPYCDPPFHAGLYYHADGGGSCSAGFTAYVSGSSAQYTLTAGHCVSVPNWPNPGRRNWTVYGDGVTGVWISQDLGGYYNGTPGTPDGGVIWHTNPSFPTYPAIRTYGWTWASYPVYGTDNATLRTWVCKSGGRTQSVQCGTVTSTNNGGGQFLFDTACTMGGDSGGPIFNPANLYALGITATLYNTPLDGPCTSSTVTGGEPVTRATSSLGLSGVSVTP